MSRARFNGTTNHLFRCFCLSAEDIAEAKLHLCRELGRDCSPTALAALSSAKGRPNSQGRGYACKRHVIAHTCHCKCYMMVWWQAPFKGFRLLEADVNIVTAKPKIWAEAHRKLKRSISTMQDQAQPSVPRAYLDGYKQKGRWDLAPAVKKPETGSKGVSSWRSRQTT